MEKEVVSIFGMGLIGGSLALELQQREGTEVWGVDRSEANLSRAVELGLIDRPVSRDEAIAGSDVIILAIPVNSIIGELVSILDRRGDIMITDMGSTKSRILDAVKGHRNRACYVAAHPMAGTENSGPDAAFIGLFKGKVAIICEQERSYPEAVKWVEGLFRYLDMRTRYMDGESHDMHAAYVSHVSHISSFILSATVLEKEKSEKAILDMAGGGFESTVRLAKSSPVMWSQIFEQNDKYVVEVLNTYIQKMTVFKEQVEAGNFDWVETFMRECNEIKKILN